MTAVGTVLIVGASRGLGVGLAAEYLRRGWSVIGTVRGTNRTELHDIAAPDGRLTVENVDITEPRAIAELRARLAGRTIDVLLANAAIALGDIPIAEVPTDMFVAVMVTNALGPMRVVESLDGLVPPDGTIAVMSSSQGSVSLNTNGGQDVYRASKAALNQLMRCYAARHPADPRTLLLINPGWVQTELGGPKAPLTVEQSVPGIVTTIDKHRGEPGLQFLDYRDQVVPW
jgi:NAD(P)-dependent dehydrogenase (short-subunit alcohol dehydrogenase family)